ncbi:MAG: hypothetical protein ACR2NO_00250 [Chloroflexota bacterium]
MPDAAVQRNLSQFTQPVIHQSYTPKAPKRPGTMEDWEGFVSRVAAHCESMYRDARILRAKRAEMINPATRPIARGEAERNFKAALKRASDHAKDLAREFLQTGMTREHLQNHLELAGTEHDRRPEYPLALLYSKLMGIEFEEQRVVVDKDEAGQEVSTTVTQRKKYTWAMELKSAEVDDFFTTLRPLGEALPMLASRFRSRSVRPF